MDTEENKSAFQFDNPTLIESVFFENLSYNGDLTNIGQLKFKLQKNNGQKQKVSKNRVGIPVFLTVTTSDEMKLTDDTPCFIRMTMRANFVWEDKQFSKKEISSFLSINAPSLLLGYIRPKITDITENSDITTQHIPFIDFSNNLD